MNVRLPTILVLGGSGFIGRHVVGELSLRPCRVVVGSRHPGRIDACLPAGARLCEQRQVRFERMLEPRDWNDVLEDVDVVINCVGILRQRGRATYDRLHHLAPGALAQATRKRRLRFIHVSALGLDAPVRSRFLKSKRDGERAIRRSGTDWFIVRPSLLDGEGGFGARWLRRISRWPVHPVPVGADGRIAALDVRDLGEALARLALKPRSLKSEAAHERELELGGLEPRTLAGHLRALRRLHTRREARSLPIPAWLARLGSHLCDLLHVTPYSYGHWELLGRDNCPSHNRLPELLGREPRTVGKESVDPELEAAVQSA